MFGVEMGEELLEPYYVTVKVDGQDITFETDSVATASVISEKTYRMVWRSNRPRLWRSKLSLRTHTGQPIPHLGVLCVDIAAESQVSGSQGGWAQSFGP